MANRVEAKVPWDSTEAEDWKAPVRIVGLYNAAYVENSTFILVWFAQKMQGFRIAWISVRGCVVNCSNKRYSPSSSEVVYKSRFLVNQEVINDNAWVRLGGTWNCGLASLKVIDCRDKSVKFDSSRWNDRKLDASTFVCVAQRSQRHRDLRQCDIFCIVTSRQNRGKDERATTRDFFQNFNVVYGSVFAHAQTATLKAVNIL